MGWRINNENKIFNYLEVTPGFQIIYFGESPDFVLPAASLGLGKKLSWYGFTVYAKSHLIATISPNNGFIAGSIWGVGIGYKF